MGITILVGCAPNLPWWRLQRMTDVEIEAYNRSFLVEVEMKDENIITVSPNGLTKDQTSDLARLTAKQIYTQGYVAGELVTQTQTWNAAIDAAVIAMQNSPDNSAAVYNMRKLKK